MWKFVLSTLLVMVLALNPVWSYAQTDTALTPTSFQMPNVSQIAKRIVTRGIVLVYAVEQLLGAVDWLLDLENNQIKFKDLSTAQGDIMIVGGPIIFCDLAKGKKISNIDEAISLSKACWASSPLSQGGSFVNYEIRELSIFVNLRSKAGDKYNDIYGFSSITRYGEKSVSLDVVAQQIIQNAQNGHQPSIDFLKDVADDVAKQSVSNGDDTKLDVKPINPPKDESNEPKQCKPCQPYPVGDIGYIGPKTVQHGIDRPIELGGTGRTHYKQYRVEQNTKTCMCYWKLDSRVNHHLYEKPSGKDLNKHTPLNKAWTMLSYYE